MVKALIAGIEDSYDESMAGTYDSEEYKSFCNKVDEAHSRLTNLLDDEEQIRALETLLDAVSNRDGFIASKAYTTGVYEGISFREYAMPKK